MRNKQKEKFLLTISASFDAAHQIRIPGSVCEKMHGHRWTLEATFSGKLGRDGMVKNFLDLEAGIRKRVISVLDHSNLNELFDSPTTELICRWIWERLKGMGIVELRLWETPSFSVTYRKGR